MARDFLASQVRTNQLIASRSLSNSPSLSIISASNANGFGVITNGGPSDSSVFVFVSGSRGSDAFTVFGGSVKVSGSLIVFDNTILSGGLTGSLQRVPDGSSYLSAGTGITLSTASNGQVTITATGTAGAGGSNTQVQFNDSGALSGDDGLVYNKTTKTLTLGNLFVTGAITAITTSNLSISDAVIYLASGSVGPGSKSVIAFASGSSTADKALILGSLGSNDIIVAARQDVSGGLISQSNLSFTDLVPIRASKFEIGGPAALLTSSNSLDAALYSDGAGSVSIIPGSTGLILGNPGSPVSISGSSVRVGDDIPGNDVYLFVSGSGSSKRALFGGDVVSSGSIIVKGSTGTTAVVGTIAGVFSASSNILGGGNLTVAGDATVRGGLLTLANTAGNAILEQDSSGHLNLRNITNGGDFFGSVRTTGGNTVNFLYVTSSTAASETIVAVMPSVYPAAASPFLSTDTNFLVGGAPSSKDGASRGTAVFGGDVMISGSVFLGRTGADIVNFRSNLGSNIIPDSDMLRNLGSPVRRFANVYTGDLHLRNDRGDYTLIEESDCLTIRFNKTGKRYKFVLEPAPEFDEN